jgi:hypothetical protein
MPDNTVFYCPPDEAERKPPPWPEGCPIQGLYHDKPYDDYRRWKALNATVLKHGGELSPKHMRQSVEDGTDSTSRKFGRAAHCRFLEPQAFKDRILIAGPCSKPLASGKRKGEPCGLSSTYRGDDGAWYCGKHRPDGAEEPADYISQAEADALEEMVSAVFAHPSVSLMRQHGGTEVSLVWDREGVPCKARLDKLIVDASCPDTIIDLKKVAAYAIDKHSIESAIANYYYDVQAYWYTDGLRRVTGKDAHFIWLFVEDGPPFDVLPLRASKKWLETGRCRAEAAFAAYRHCLETGEWPGVAGDIQESSPPAWLCKRYGVT